MPNPRDAYLDLLRDLPNTAWPSPDVPPGDYEGSLWSIAQNPSCPPQIKREAERILAEFAAERKSMPHPDYTLDRELSAYLARSPESAHHLTVWYNSGNPEQAVSSLRQAATRALRRIGDDAPTPEQREDLGRLLADLAALK